MTTVSATDQFLTGLAQNKAVRKRFPVFRAAHERLKTQKTGCCGQSDSAGRVAVIGTLREFVLRINPNDASELKRLLGLPVDVKILVSSGIGRTRTERRV